ncbi:MAG TPA: hypothetical protein VFF12_13330 [Myxococcaceae bacterium]|nr:hypothetical protein [Myxococcaceae bacterium]
MPRVVTHRPWVAGLLCALTLAPTAVHATTVRKHLTIIELLEQSELIVRGRVTKLADGVDARGIPYTEVTLQIAESLKGTPGRELTFRQFGLIAPRKMPDGRVNLMVTPAAWATYSKGQESIFFLRKPAAWTGLRTTAGLGQGQFKVSGAGATNSVENAGLFERVVVDPGLLAEAEQRVMGTTGGAVNTRGFSMLVKRAVAEKWIEHGRMRHADR